MIEKKKSSGSEEVAILVGLIQKDHTEQQVIEYLDELEFEESKPKKPPIPWYSTDELTLAKAAELGITPYAGESYAQLRQRISTQISRQATV